MGVEVEYTGNVSYPLLVDNVVGDSGTEMDVIIGAPSAIAGDNTVVPGQVRNVCVQSFDYCDDFYSEASFCSPATTAATFGANSLNSATANAAAAGSNQEES